MFISNAYAQTTAAPSGAAGMMQFLPLVLMFVVLYFIMIRPQMKRQKEHRAMIDALAKGDEVVIGGGVIGRVAKMGDSVLHLLAEDYLAALKDAERVLLLGAPTVADHLARAELYQRLDCPHAERFDLQHALLLCDDPAQRLLLGERLRQLAATPALH